MISSIHYQYIQHPSTSSTKSPRCHQPVPSPDPHNTVHTQQSTNILTPLGLGYDIIHALSSHPSIHLLDQVTPLPPTPQSRSTQHTHNNQLTYSHPLALDMISSIHYQCIQHPSTSWTKSPRCHQPVPSPYPHNTVHTQQSTDILTPLGLGYDIIHALSMHPASIHLLDQVTPLPPTSPQSRSTQHTHNNQLTYSHPLALDMISSMHYHLITSIHPPTQPSQPLVTNPTIQIHTTHTQQSTNILTPLCLGYDIIHAL